MPDDDDESFLQEFDTEEEKTSENLSLIKNASNDSDMIKLELPPNKQLQEEMKQPQDEIS